MSRVLTLTAALLLGLILSTLAEAATTTGGWVNIRSGPGTKYDVVTIAWPGVTFDVHHCTRLWCAVTYNGMNGWIGTRWITR